MPEKTPSAPGRGKRELTELHGYFAGEDGASRGSIHGDVRGLVGFQQLFVDGDDVVEAGREGMLGREAVEHRDDLHFCEVGDGNRFGPRAGVGIESATMNVEQDAVGVHAGNGRDDAHGNAGDGGFGATDRIELRRNVAGMVLPDVGAVTAFLKGGWMGRVGDLAGERLFRLGAEVGRNGNNAGDVRGAFSVDVAGVGVGRLSGGGSLGSGLLREGGNGSKD